MRSLRTSRAEEKIVIKAINSLSKYWKKINLKIMNKVDTT
jgi:hypothetical protein